MTEEDVPPEFWDNLAKDLLDIIEEDKKIQATEQQEEFSFGTEDFAELDALKNDLLEVVEEHQVEVKRKEEERKRVSELRKKEILEQQLLEEQQKEEERMKGLNNQEQPQKKVEKPTENQNRRTSAHIPQESTTQKQSAPQSSGSGNAMNSSTGFSANVNLKEGFLKKRGNIVKNWKNRWWVLKPDGFYYYESRKSWTPLGVIPISEVKSIEDLSQGEKEALKLPSTLQYFFLFKIVTAKRDYQVAATSPEEKNEWMSIGKEVLMKIGS